MSRVDMCGRSFSKSMWLIYAAITAVWAQNPDVQHEVTGYVGTDVTLPCQYIQESQHALVIEIRWSLNTPEGELKSIISLSNGKVSSFESPLMHRVEITHDSLKIKDVTMADTGSYTCSISTLFVGAFKGTTKLVIQRETRWIPRMISTGVSVMIVVIMAATTFLIIYKIRRKASDKSHVSAGADNAMTDTSHP